MDLEDSMEVEGDSVANTEDHNMVMADLEDTTEVVEGDLVEALVVQVDIMVVEEEDLEDIMEEEVVGPEDQVVGKVSFNVVQNTRLSLGFFPMSERN